MTCPTDSIPLLSTSLLNVTIDPPFLRKFVKCDMWLPAFRARFIIWASLAYWASFDDFKGLGLIFESGTLMKIFTIKENEIKIMNNSGIKLNM